MRIAFREGTSWTSVSAEAQNSAAETVPVVKHAPKAMAIAFKYIFLIYVYPLMFSAKVHFYRRLPKFYCVKFQLFFIFWRLFFSGLLPPRVGWSEIQVAFPEKRAGWQIFRDGWQERLSLRLPGRKRRQSRRMKENDWEEDNLKIIKTLAVCSFPQID